MSQWSNALCEKRKHLDMFVSAAFENDKIIGMAGCSADCDSMWQIGVDVLPEYRRKGVARHLLLILLLKYSKEVKYRSTAVPGLIFGLFAMR